MSSLATLEHPGDYCDNQAQANTSSVQGTTEDRGERRALYIWDRTIVKLRTSLRRTKVRPTSGEESNILAEKRECVRLSTDTSEDFV